jgi:hypothetical protein
MKICRYTDTCINKEYCEEEKMHVVSKTLIPNKEWILEDHGQKIGSIAKNKKGYWFLRKGQAFVYKNLEEITAELGINLVESPPIHKFEVETSGYSIYDYPCSSKPFEPVYNVRKKLPLFAKSDKSKSQYCAGYYVIKFRKGWVKSFCPKLITLERNNYHGPFKTENEMKIVLNTVNKL